MKNLTALTGIRFIAAFYVFIFHINMRFPLEMFHWSLQNVIKQGALGVNIFFLLSGFILTYSYHLKINSLQAGKHLSFLKSFLWKRIARVYPAYLVGFIAALLVSLSFGHFEAHFPLILFLNLFMLESYIPPLSMMWYGGGAWSISTEFFFYTIFVAILLPLLKIKSPVKLLCLLAGFFVLSAIPGLLYNIRPQESYYYLQYTFPPFRAFEFLCGVTAGILTFRFNLKIKLWAVLLLLATTLVYLGRLGHVLKGYSAHNIILLPTITAVLIHLASENPGVWLKWVGCKLMEYLGKISYGFYIMQIPILMVIENLLDKKVITHQDFYLIPMIFATNLIASILLYHLIELPAQMWLTSNYSIKQQERQETEIQLGNPIEKEARA